MVPSHLYGRRHFVQAHVCTIKTTFRCDVVAEFFVGLFSNFNICLSFCQPLPCLYSNLSVGLSSVYISYNLISVRLPNPSSVYLFASLPFFCLQYLRVLPLSVCLPVRPLSIY